MKKRILSLFALLITLSLLTLCAGCSKPAETAKPAPANPSAAADAGSSPGTDSGSTARPVSGRNAALDAAFASGEAFRLEPVDLPSGNLDENRMAVGLSPDGQTVIWRTWTKEEGKAPEYSLALTRNGETIPVRFTADRGAGDPYGKEAFFTSYTYQELPGLEGFSWSADGRYIAVSHVEYAVERLESPGVAVIDAATGELYLAASYLDGREAIRDGSYTGEVITSRIDRNGQYCWFLAFFPDGSGDRSYCFCRCPVGGGAPEILYEMKRDNNQPFDVTYSSALTEMADGSWLLAGINGSQSGTNGKYVRHALIRFSPAGDAWTMTVTPVGIPYANWRTHRFFTSAASGYSVACLLSSSANQQASLAQTSSAASVELAKASVSLALFGYVNMLRISPGETLQRDVWCLRGTGEADDPVKAEPSETALLSYKMMRYDLTDDDAESLLKWGPEIDAGTRLPKGYDANLEARAGSGRWRIGSLCLSPDGYYTLAVASNDRSQALWLISMETMEVRKVDSPESLNLWGIGTSMTIHAYYPQMIWNEDGTLLILNASTSQTEAFRLAYGEQN